MVFKMRCLNRESRVPSPESRPTAGQETAHLSAPEMFIGAPNGI